MALLEAGHRSRREFYRGLMKGGSRPNHQDAEGRTALHIAAVRDDSVICCMLLAAGTLMDLRDSDGRTRLG
jgi:ankyrin repeat protein